MLAEGFRFSWQAFAMIVLVNTGFAAVYWIEDPRPFWHPLISAQCNGLAIAYCAVALVMRGVLARVIQGDVGQPKSDS